MPSPQPVHLRRNDFQKALQDKPLDVKKAEQDPRLQGVDVKKADLNGDGQVKGAEETSKLFDQLDAKDNNGDKDSLRLIDPNGKPGRTFAPTAAVAQHSGAKDLADRLKKGIAANEGATPPSARPKVADVAKEAKRIVETRGEDYGVPNKWVNSDPTHVAPVGKPIHGTDGKWKCNLFGGNAMAAAGFEPPKYGNTPKGEYPNANQYYKWSDKYAAQNGNKVHFEHRGEVTPGDYPAGPERDKAVAELLSKAKPGDLVLVDHPGTDVADGGHVRVVVGNSMKPDGTGTLDSAQARHDAARIKQEEFGPFTGEERIWILRPNRPLPQQTEPVGHS